MKLLEVKDIVYYAGEKKVLNGISFDGSGGEIIGIIGANGSGKTTLLKIIDNIFSITSGEIYVMGKKISEYSDKEKAQKIAFMNQNTNVVFDFPCIDIVVLGRFPYLSRFAKYSKQDFEIAEKYMKLTNTYKFRNKSILALSGGERQRVLFAKLLTQESPINLLDEPSSAMDMMFENELFKFIGNMKRENKLIITVIHDLRIAIKYCTRLILLKDGKILKDGEPNEVITEDNLKLAYGVDVRTYHNHISDSLDFCIM